MYLPGLHHLTADKLLEHKGGHVLVILGLDVGQVALDGLEGEAEEVCPDLLEAVHGQGGVAAVVEELDVTGAGLLVMGHNLTPEPAPVTRGGAHRVQDHGLGNLRGKGKVKFWLHRSEISQNCSTHPWTVELTVSVVHALVQALQGKVGGMAGLLKENVA